MPLVTTPSAGRSIYGTSRPLLVGEPRPSLAAALVAAGSFFVLAEWLLTGNFLLLFIGMFLFIVALLIHSEPHHHAANGALALVLVFTSLLFGFGGFYLGALLAGIGGILAIAWSPPKLATRATAGRQSSG